jgi:hypothetical protein
MIKSILRSMVVIGLITGSFCTIAATVNITTSDTSYTNTGALTGSVGIKNTGSRNIIVNSISGAITAAETNNSTNAQGIYSLTDSNIITNYGNITVTSSGDLSNAVGIRSYEDNNTLTNYGTINVTTSGNDGSAYGIRSSQDNNSLTNFGAINVNAGSGGAVGISSFGSDNTLTNSGTITARGSDFSRAISVQGNNNTVNINKGSLLVGDIYATGTGNKLNINMGAGASYAYQATGDWSVHDFDSRPVVTGSAYAAGIGAQETAGQMLYQRTSSVTNSLDRRIRDYTSYNQSKVYAPYWVDTYYSDSSRGAGNSTSVQTNFSNQNYGFTAGARLPIKLTSVEAIINFEQTALNIADSSQTIDTSSVIVGLLAPKIAEKWGINLSSKAMMGWGGHSGNRTVYTNSLMYNGSQNVTSEYDSIYGIVGSALTSSYVLTNYLQADVLAGFDVDIQSVSSYSESAYFHWNDRTLTQLQSRLQAGLITNLLNNTLSFFGRVGVEQRDLVGGQAQNYQIQGTNVSFNGGRMDNTYVTGQLGTTYDVYKRVKLFGVISSTNGFDSVQAIQGNFGVRTSF